jgi:hypothetical protein
MAYTHISLMKIASGRRANVICTRFLNDVTSMYTVHRCHNERMSHLLESRRVRFIESVESCGATATSASAPALPIG